MFVLLAAYLAGSAATAHPYLHFPSVDTYAFHNPGGVTVLPEGRLLKPAGWATPVSKWPYGLAVSPDAATCFVASEGVGQWIEDWTSSRPKVKSFSVGQGHTNGGAATLGPDGKLLYWSTGASGGVYVYPRGASLPSATISLDVSIGGRKFEDSYVSDLALSPDGSTLYCADFTNFRVAVVDTSTNSVVATVPVGRCPYALALAGNRLYVANIGQFEYAAVPRLPQVDPLPGGVHPKDLDPRGLTFPPFGYPSKEAVEGVQMEGRQIPGLGDPAAPEAFSVYGIDVSDPHAPKVVTRAKTGLPVLASGPAGFVEGGSGPCFLLANGSKVYVANNGSDSVQEIDAATGQIQRTVLLEPSPLVRGLRGIGPTGMVLSKDAKTLYVAESGLNGIAAIDTGSFTTLGCLPTAWYPYRVGLSPDSSKLACICFKGFGNGPKGSANAPTDPFMHMQGSFHTLPVPTTSAGWASSTAEVLQNMGIVDASADYPRLKSPVWSGRAGQPSNQIQYVVFIAKENHTFDTIFDRIPGSNNDPSLLRWGHDQTISATGQPTLEHVSVMRNHNKLARKFTVSDNFYMEPEASGVGHRWLVDVQPNNWCQILYTLGWDFKLDTTAPGRRDSFGGNSSITPEDYPEEGAMWHHLGHKGISFRNYGEGFEFAGGPEDAGMEESGIREVVNVPMPKVLFDNTCREFANFNLNIHDMHRFEQLTHDLESSFGPGKKPFPHFLNIALCADHGTDPNPKIGYKYHASYMADNDLALGKIVEYLSRTPYWKHMAIFVTEDDAGGENDHVDAQRSVLLAIGPYIKHGYVSHRHTTITSMHRTLYEIFGLPALNLFDALSNDFSDCFTATPDFTPYTADDVDHRLFDWPAVRMTPAQYKAAEKLPTVERDTYDRPQRSGRRPR